MSIVKRHNMNTFWTSIQDSVPARDPLTVNERRFNNKCFFVITLRFSRYNASVPVPRHAQDIPNQQRMAHRINEWHFELNVFYKLSVLTAFHENRQKTVPEDGLTPTVLPVAEQIALYWNVLYKNRPLPYLVPSHHFQSCNWKENENNDKLFFDNVFIILIHSCGKKNTISLVHLISLTKTITLDKRK